MLNSSNQKKYAGLALKKYNKRHNLEPYYPNEGLIRAVEVARLLERPLLLRGAPGSGKTRLAEALAFELHGNVYKDFYIRWNIKSTSKAMDGLYIYDHLKRLRDTQDRNISQKEIEENQYWELGPLGHTFDKSKANALPAVLLIDEIDKADPDFPNDLLDVLEGNPKQFSIKEVKNKQIVAEQSPIIIITSNDERELPHAFLRRCVFYYLPFPDDALLLKLAKSFIEKYDEKGEMSKIIAPLVHFFKQKHKEMESNPNVDKPISTSELLDWLKVIAFYKPYSNGVLSVGKNNELIFNDGKILYPEVLFKSFDDWKGQMGVDFI